MGLVRSGGVQANTGIFLYDDFTGANGDPVNASNWSTSIGGGSTITIQSNAVRLQNSGSTTASMTSLTNVKNGVVIRGTITYASSTSGTLTVKIGTVTLISFGGSSGLGTGSFVWGISAQRKKNGKWYYFAHVNNVAASFNTGSTTVQVDSSIAPGALFIQASATAGTHTVTADNAYIW